MRLILLCCAIFAFGVGVNCANAESSAPASKPWVSRQSTFNIPFSVDLSRGAPREVQLFVSQDAGKTWHFYGRQHPTAESFPFRASRDGDFWFASRTIDPRRAVPPVEQLKPELHVQVDTQQPKIDFTAIAGKAGEVTTAWKATDPTLDRASLKLEYKSVSEATWQAIEVDSSKLWVQDSSLLGEMTWYPQGSSSSITVRAEIADRAGNKSVVSRAVSVAKRATGVARPQGTTSVNTTPVAQLDSNGSPANQISQHASNKPASDTNFKSTVGGTTWPTNNRLRGSDSDQDSGDAVAQSNASELQQQRYPSTNAEAPSATPGSNPSSPESVNESRLPTVFDSIAQDARSSLPPGEKARMTNSLHFELAYELDSVGPEGVDEIQLWGTTNYGQSWVRWTLDEDLRSPIDVQVEKEGIYGFRVVIVGRNGLATPAPHSGDVADVWVGVDTTRPKARLTSAIYGQGVHAGELDIRWEVVDDFIGDRAVTLLFSEHPSGPWTTIAAGLPNTKQYYWSVDPNTPRKIFLRLEVRDEAGNSAEHQLVEAISTTGLVPKAYIRSVRPVSDEPREAFLRNRFYDPR